MILEKGNKRIAIECKASPAPKVTKGFWRAIEDVKPQLTFIIAPILDKYNIAEQVVVCGLEEFLTLDL